MRKFNDTRRRLMQRFVAAVLMTSAAGDAGLAYASMGRTAIVLVALLASLLAARLQPHPQRALAWAPMGGLLAFAGLVADLLTPELRWAAFLIVFGTALAAAQILYALFTPLHSHGRVRVGIALVGFTSMLMLLGWIAARGAGRPTVFLLLLTAAGAALSSVFFLREFVEQVIEVAMWPLYRIRSAGPGRRRAPMRGPALVIANHAAWLDPIWLAKVLPCRLTPMMTSRFFDLPVIGWVVRVLADAIRVPDSGFRRAAPEIRQAIERLHQGHIVMIFPEGRMRRTEKILLRRFGQGIYQILRDHPQIPVVACWIDGNWGSYTSFFNGPPTKNKKLDLWRKIRIGVSEPAVVPAEVLQDGNRTRRFLMQACFNARQHLGLDVPQVESFADKEEEETADGP